MKKNLGKERRRCSIHLWYVPKWVLLPTHRLDFCNVIQGQPKFVNPDYFLYPNGYDTTHKNSCRSKVPKVKEITRFLRFHSFNCPMHSLISGLARDQHFQCSLGPLTYHSKPHHWSSSSMWLYPPPPASLPKNRKHTCLTPKFHNRNNRLSASFCHPHKFLKQP